MAITYDKDGAYIEVTENGVVYRRAIKWEDCVVSFPTSNKLKIDRTYINDSDQLVLVLTDESEITLSASGEIATHAALPTVHQDAPGLISSHAGEVDPHTGYILHSIATAVNNFLVASGSGTFIKKTLAEVKTLLAIASDIATHAAIKAANATLGHVIVETGSLIDVDGDGKLILGAHASTHQDGGTDEPSVASLSGLLADDQHVLDAEVLEIAISKTLMTTRGDIIFRNATVPARLAKSTEGYVLTMGADDPAWAEAAGGGIWEEIGDHIVSGAEASISFASIPSGYAVFKLMLIDLQGTDLSAVKVRLTFNDDTTATNYNYIGSDSTIPVFGFIGVSGGVDYHLSGHIIINNTSGSMTTYLIDIIHSRGNGNFNISTKIGGNWEPTDEITKITLNPAGGDFDAGRVILIGLST